MVRIRTIELTFDGVNPLTVGTNGKQWNMHRFSLPNDADIVNQDMMLKNDLFEELYEKSVDLDVIHKHADCRLSGTVEIMTETAGTYSIVMFEWLD